MLLSYVLLAAPIAQTTNDELVPGPVPESSNSGAIAAVAGVGTLAAVGAGIYHRKKIGSAFKTLKDTIVGKFKSTAGKTESTAGKVEAPELRWYQRWYNRGS
eukprot:NODE_452_length_8270_cov_0.487823.p7 type:complete len:102 gc:universal NODE_452_length_8270_cov_0.487823:430-125(-)